MEAYTKEQGLFRTDATPDPLYAGHAGARPGHGDAVDGRSQAPAGPRGTAGRARRTSTTAFAAARKKTAQSQIDGDSATMGNGAVVIAAITSCTNTSNPSVMLAAGLLAKKAVERGLKVKPWVKTSLAPGSKVVTDYYREAGLMPYLEAARIPPGGLRLHHLHRQQRSAARTGGAGRPEREPGGGRGAQRQPQLRRPHQSAGEGQLPGLAAAGGGLRARRHASISTCRTIPLGHGQRRQAGLPARHLADQRGSAGDRPQFGQARHVRARVRARLRRRRELAEPCPFPPASIYQWDERSTYIKKPPYFDEHGRIPKRRSTICTACACWRCWAIPSPPTIFRRPAPSPGRQPRRAVPDRAGRGAGGLQLLRRAARQSRGDGARHARQHPPAQPTGAGTEGGWTRPPARRRADVHLRRLDAVPEGRRAADDHRGQGVRLGLLARLGGQGRAAAGRARGDRGELRAHSPHESGGHGRAAAAIPGRRDRRRA